MGLLSLRLRGRGECDRATLSPAADVRGMGSGYILFGGGGEGNVMGLLSLRLWT